MITKVIFRKDDQIPHASTCATVNGAGAQPDRTPPQPPTRTRRDSPISGSSVDHFTIVLCYGDSLQITFQKGLRDCFKPGSFFRRTHGMAVL